MNESNSTKTISSPSADNASEQAVQTIRVLHLINGEHYSGAERVQDLLAARLPDYGFEVGFVCVKPDRFPEMRNAKQAALYELPMRNKFDMRVVWKVVRLVKQENYKLLHAHTPRTAMIARAASAISGVPMIYHVHSPASRDTTQSLRNWFNATVEKLSLCGISRLITVSESLGRHMQEQGFAAERISVVPNGVPTMSPPKRSPPQHDWTIGTVALFRPRKGTEILIEALAKLRDRGLSVKLRAVGPFETTEYEADLKKRAADLNIEDRIHWTGFTRDVGAELLQMDLFALPSLFGEGLPMVVLEAMASGVPVVGTRVEGVPEAIRDSVDGALAEPGDADDFAKAMERIISGELDWSDLRSSAIQRQAERFSDHSMASGTTQAYRQTLEKQ